MSKKIYSVSVVHRITGEESYRRILAADPDTARKLATEEDYYVGPATECKSGFSKVKRWHWITLALFLFLAAAELTLRTADRSVVMLFDGSWKVLSKAEKDHDRSSTFSSRRMDAQRWLRSDEALDAAWIHAQYHVKETLKSPLTAIFPSRSELDQDRSQGVVWSEDRKIFIIGGYVDSQNSFGALVRSGFVGELRPPDIVFSIEKDDPRLWEMEFLHFLDDYVARLTAPDDSRFLKDRR